MDTTEHEDMILVAALVRFSHDYEPADEHLPDTAWNLAERIAAEYDMGRVTKPFRLCSAEQGRASI